MHAVPRCCSLQFSAQLGWWLDKIICVMIARVLLNTFHPSPLPCSSHWCFQQASLGPSSMLQSSSPNLATWITSEVSGLLVLTDFLFWLPEPGAVGHLSFTEILDTSLKVSWQEPVEKNGIITGKYQLLLFSFFFYFFFSSSVWGRMYHCNEKMFA